MYVRKSRKQIQNPEKLHALQYPCFMVDGTVVSDFSSLCFTSIYQPKHSDFCVNCKALNCELQKIHEEPKSAQLIIEL